MDPRHSVRYRWPARAEQKRLLDLLSGSPEDAAQGLLGALLVRRQGRDVRDLRRVQLVDGPDVMTVRAAVVVDVGVRATRCEVSWRQRTHAGHGRTGMGAPAYDGVSAY